MAPGALITAPFQYELGNGVNALLMGSGTPIKTEKIVGLFDLPEIKDRDMDKQSDHGAFPGVDLLSKRKIEITANVLTDETSLNRIDAQRQMATQINLCRRWLQPSAMDLFFVFRRPAAVAPYYFDFLCLVRPKRRSLPSDSDLALGLGKLITELHAADPRIYSLASYTQHCDIPNGVANSAAIIHPNGEASAYPVITINGPTQDIRIQNGDDSNRAIKLDLAMGGGDVLVIDTLAKTVALNGVYQYQYVRTDNQWWKLIPQIDNHITYNRTGVGAGSTCALTWRDAWL